jgi:hypothetical protein
LTATSLLGDTVKVTGPTYDFRTELKRWVGNGTAVLRPGSSLRKTGSRQCDAPKFRIKQRVEGILDAGRRGPDALE